MATLKQNVEQVLTDEDQPKGAEAQDGESTSEANEQGRAGDDQDPEDDDQDPEGADQDPEGADQLGDAGKKALDRMKSERNDERKARRVLQKRLEAMEAAQAAAGKSDDEKALAEARREATAEATVKANKRIVRSEVKAAAAKKFRDASDAVALLDLDQFEVDENGDVDSDEITEALDDLLTRKPHLAAQGGSTSFDSGRGKPRPKKKLTRDDLKSMTPAQIVKARKEGRLDL